MDKTSFGVNNVFWMEFVHMEHTFCIRIKVEDASLTTELIYVYKKNDMNSVEELSKQLLKANTTSILLGEDITKERLYCEAVLLICEVEKMYDITFSQVFKNIALKVFCQEAYSAYLNNKYDWS